MSEQFPRGKIHETDEGAIQIGVAVDGDCVVIAFPAPTAWVGMPAEQAEELASILTQRAQEARRNRQ
jgi:hypothetical protein